MGKLKVLVCPMDWGLGHASRCIPVINAFRDAGCRVVVASSGPGAGLIRREYKLCDSEGPGFPGRRGDGHDGAAGNDWLEIIPFPGFSVSYSRHFLFLRLLIQVPAFLYHIYRERVLAGRLVRKAGPDIIVSDNRYGLVHKSVPSVIITHQLRPSLPACLRPFEWLVSRVVRHWIRSFDECWIPDCRNDPAAGSLAGGWDRLPAAYFIGWISRFAPLKGTASGYRYKLMFLLSGPEPQRSMLEDMIIEGMKGRDVRALLVRGLPDVPVEWEKRGGLEIVSFLDSADISRFALLSELMVCRSGYSSVMDLLVMGKGAVLVPTPGQTEQEYLGRWLSRKGWFRVVKQKDLDVGLLAGMEELQAPGYMMGADMLRERVAAMVKKMKERKRDVNG